MALIRRFKARPDEVAVTETKPEEPVVPVEEKLAIETMVPEEPKPETVKEPVAEAQETIPEKITETPTPEPVKEEPSEEGKEETEEETKEEEPAAPETPDEEPAEEEPKKTKRSKKTIKAETPKVVNISNALKKNLELTDALKDVVPDYQDTAFEEFKEQMDRDLLRTAFDETADAGVIKVILSNLGRCYDNAAKQYAEINKNLEHLTNKSYGLITRQIVMNTNGANEAERKQNGVHAPEVYKTPGGSTINLYALQAALEAEAIYVQMVMKKLEYKRSTLIAFLTANKLESSMIGD